MFGPDFGSIEDARNPVYPFDLDIMTMKIIRRDDFDLRAEFYQKIR